jgi:Tol biopolymer transport system component
MLFQCDRLDGLGGTDIWVSKRSIINDDLAWEQPINLGPVINSNMNELGATYLLGNAGSGNKLYFSSNRTDTGGLGGADLYFSDVQDGGVFSFPVDLFELNSASNDTCLTLRDDGLEIIFSSNRPDLSNSTNAFDLWSSHRRSAFDSWDTPTNLGSVINADGYLDANPALSADGKTLVFTSNRIVKGASGNMDLYVTTRRKIED